MQVCVIVTAWMIIVEFVKNGIQGHTDQVANTITAASSLRLPHLIKLFFAIYFANPQKSLPVIISHVDLIPTFFVNQ